MTAGKRKYSTTGYNAEVRAAADQLPIPGKNLSFLSQLALTNPGPIKQNCIRQSEFMAIPPITAVRPDSRVSETFLCSGRPRYVKTLRHVEVFIFFSDVRF